MNTQHAYSDALERALGRVIADAQRNVAQHASEARAIIAECQARVVKLEFEMREMVRVSLAAVKDGEKGEQGEKGEKGETGETGAQGSQGEKGETGLSGERGTDGSDGSPGAQGERGEPGGQGPPGIKGEDGAPGHPGERGLQGMLGMRGEAGLAGERGEKGEPGEDGERGEKGEAGAIGAEGPPGKLPAVRAWEDGVHYEDDVVTHNGATYQAKCDTAKEPSYSARDWLCLAAHGQDGKPFNVCGTYSPSEDYKSFDVVACNKSSFVALKDDPGPCPGDGWQLMAGAGSRGDRGDKGERGPEGKIGPEVSIKSWEVDSDGYIAWPVMKNGEKGPPLELRDLFEKFLIETK